MKSSIITKLIGGTAIVMMFLASSTVWALPPRQHAVRGVIENIDQSTHTLTVAPANGKTPLVFVWKDSTRFTQGGSKICLGTLEAGLEVKVHYRREIGQLVPREVTLRTETPTRCTTGGCCDKRS